VKRKYHLYVNELSVKEEKHNSSSVAWVVALKSQKVVLEIIVLIVANKENIYITIITQRVHYVHKKLYDSTTSWENYGGRRVLYLCIFI